MSFKKRLLTSSSWSLIRCKGCCIKNFTKRNASRGIVSFILVLLYSVDEASPLSRNYGASRDYHGGEKSEEGESVHVDWGLVDLLQLLKKLMDWLPLKTIPAFLYPNLLNCCHMCHMTFLDWRWSILIWSLISCSFIRNNELESEICLNFLLSLLLHAFVGFLYGKTPF